MNDRQFGLVGNVILHCIDEVNQRQA